ncbi:MAG: TatD family hydrolase [Fervidicoccaceae archaeon]
MTKLPFADAHSHSNPISGIGAKKIAEKIKEHGGWFAAFIMLPSWDYVGKVIFDVEKYRELAELHSRGCKEARSSGIEIKCFAGLHPAEIDRLIEAGINPNNVREYAFKIAEILREMCREGKIDGIGEVGRQHFKVQVPSALITQEALEKFMTVAKDEGCLMQLHLEQVEGFTAESIVKLVEKTGFKKDYVLIHHSTLAVSKDSQSLGLWSTMLGKKELLEAAIPSRGTALLLLESDFIDDPKRPGRVIYPWEIGSSLNYLLSAGRISENEAEKLSIDNVRTFFRL